MKISVIGSGGWGTAMTLLLCSNGHEVCLWSYRSEESLALKKDRENKEFLPGIGFGDYDIKFTSDIKEAADFGEILVSAVPSKAVRTTARALGKVADGKTVVNISKGIDEEKLCRLSEVFKEEMPSSCIAVLSGPSHAEEVARSIPTTNVLACDDSELVSRLQDIFMSPHFRVYTNPDVAGVEFGGALKNIIALCAGITDGLGYGDNTKAALMTRGLHEIMRLGVKMGAKQETFSGLSGIGDLIVTCTSMHSRNRRAGILIGQGKSLDEALREVHMTVEGVSATEAAYRLSQKVGVEMPIVNAAYRVLFEGKDARSEVIALMTRDKKSEADIY
ncbi:MAG: NAD(P)H-dependent glycerol-3-phosphate dehydrogenase [Ruminococcaceae bacterium]|nr:NAD(P)H-dependent glycerol-3-phosphate dehydrogenase [Oscillospiraceae bacterium]